MIEFACSCARKSHRAPVEGYEISSGAIEKIPAILKDYQKIYVVSDKNTHRVAGERVERLLAAHGMLFTSLVLDGEIVLPNAETIGKIVLNANPVSAKADPFAYSDLPDFILAVGSGVINDSCRVASHRLHLPYGVVATAPSMDGYVSAGSPILHDGTKSTVQATTPKYLIADLDVLKDAPYDMMLAGIGDMFGKYVGILDWELARDYSGEYYCEKIANDVIEATDKCLKNGYLLQSRDPACVKNIMEGFLVTGLGMAFTGNSRPASGSEHIVAHSWELFDVAEGKMPNLHGLEVCEGTRLIAIMYKMLLAETDDAHLKALIEKYIPYFDAVEEFCVKMQVPPTVTDRETILRGLHCALTLRDRYTILFYLRDHGLFESYAERAADRLMALL
ncbi:MAG: sn-glycerol-1-phosphate dehydrogenase [Clostridia bacterium]|nr:sn-glycerol-1-phosphate dehydrogenase [Clostridia bacterium]